MQLQGRDLKIRMKGEDVALLHQELTRLGYQIPTHEKTASYFGPGTKQAVLKLQERLGLEPTGVVDSLTAQKMAVSPENIPVEPTAAAYLVQGIVRDEEEKPLADILIHAIDKDMRGDNLLGETRTDPQGYYRLEYSEDQFRRSEKEQGGPDLLVTALDANGNTLASSNEINNASNVETVDLIVKSLPPTVEEWLEVQGTVRLSNNHPVWGVTVSAFDRDLRSEQFLGQSHTDRDGFYQIRYTARQFRRLERGSADLAMKVISTDGALLATSPILFNAPRLAKIDITLTAEERQPQTLFERINEALTSVLEEIKIEDLEENQEYQDLSFLSGETGFERDLLARFVLAHKLTQEGIQAEFWFAMLGGSFFQYRDDQSLAEQVVTLIDSLVSLNILTARKALLRAINQEEIARAFEAKIAEWLEEFSKLAAHRSVSDTAKTSFVKQALEEAGILDAKKKEKFARLYNEHQALTAELLNSLEADRSFKKEEIANLRASFQLAELTQGDFSVVKALKDEYSIRQPERVRDLAKRSEDEWVDWVKTKHASGAIQLPLRMGRLADRVELPAPELYGKLLERQFREAFPTTAFVGGLNRALQDGGAGGIQKVEELKRFLDHHENFEFLNTSVDEFFTSGLHSDFRNLANDESFRLEVKAVQRVFKLAPSFEATNTLLAEGLHSAQQIYRMGESEFVREYGARAGFTEESARLAWNRAADTHAAVLTIVGDLLEFDAGILPGVLRSSHPDLANFPNWNNLFKAGDLCDCEDCRSVLSPAAYFADILMFLKDRKAKNPAVKVKDILFARRPDLGYLELNCDNALTTLPYIDVVCEVLEDVVDATDENDLALPGLTAIPADATVAKTAVGQAFMDAFAVPANAGKEQIELGSDWSLSQVDPLDPDQWVVHGNNATYLLKKKTTSNFFAVVLRNTKASAAELRAYPEYVNPKAYATLKQAKYPLALPFDLFAEEVRATFQKANLQRWDLMRTFQSTAGPSIGDIAAEYFSISTDPTASFDEKRLILVADTTDAGQQALWGVTGTNWLAEVGTVKTFLQKTSLEYNDLLALLDLKFINPNGDITVQHLDPSCDTDQKVVETLDAEKLDRIHRFLRLWRKLKGWKMWELDLVIRHPAIGKGTLNEAFLVSLFYFSQLRNKLGGKTTVEQVCALFGNFNTQSHFTKLHEKREEALYQTLFLNKKLIRPLDPAFEIDPGTGDLIAGQTITDHQSVVLAAVGIREADLVLLKELTKASDGTLYISDALNLSNLSFLWRHFWLSKLLKFKIEEWKVLLKLFQQDTPNFTDAKIGFDFVEALLQLKTTAFSADELNWLLAADRTAKAAVKEADAARFLANLRKELQAIQAEYDPAQYEFLTATPPADVESLTALLTSLLQKLNRTEAETTFFLAALRGSVQLESTVDDLPTGFSFPATITTSPNYIPIEYDAPNKTLRFTGLMMESQRTVLMTDDSLSTVTGLNSYQQAIEELFQQSLTATNRFISVSTTVQGLPSGFVFPANVASIPIRYDESSQTLRFIGLMTAADKTTLLTDPSLAAVTGVASYVQAIEELFNRPRQLLKFFEPVFTAPLAHLPVSVDFKTLTDPNLVLKISYDEEQRLLRFAGIMSKEEKAALDMLSTDTDYLNAVNSLFTQPTTIAPPDERIWITEADLDITQPANDTLAKRLANAVNKALEYLSKILTRNAIVQESAAKLGLTEALTRQFLEEFHVMPPTPSDPINTGLMVYLIHNFVSTTGVVDYATPGIKIVFDGWYWVSRVAVIAQKWKLTLTELKQITGFLTGAQLIDFLTLPLDDTAAIASIYRFLRTNRLLHLRDTLPEPKITLLEVLEQLNNGAYVTTTDFANDVMGLDDTWLASDITSLITTFNLSYPSDYMLTETWERIRRAFYFLDCLHASADTVKTFAAPAMSETHAKTLKELLRSKLGSETWLELSVEIQDVLREHKRDALAAYILTLPIPADAPSDKWENTNDPYAYYLLDVEMSSCQLTSRLVQASGSVQLFVQRCFMGLESDKVVVQADGPQGDTAWRWWKWMRKFRVWEANRKIFLWPENWTEPELRKDKSQFFKDLENELLQNEINQHTVETALAHYLEKLNDVAQLEIAGFYQEDQGDEAIIHVFGRTKGAEPHLYYYRRYDYRQWTPWEKVELDIRGDYLIPAVVNGRLFLFWPVFTEVPDDNKNKSQHTPSANSDIQLPDTWKKLTLQMAISEYRQGKWTPKKVSKDVDKSEPYNVEILRTRYVFLPIDTSLTNGKFGIHYRGNSVGLDSFGKAFPTAYLAGNFEISGCDGLPELSEDFSGSFVPAFRPETASTDDVTSFMKWAELISRKDAPENDFTLQNRFSVLTPILAQTPGIFRMSTPWHLSYIDKLLVDGLLSLMTAGHGIADFGMPIGSWLPFFYNDKKRTFFVLPLLPWGRTRDRSDGPGQGIRYYYPEIKKGILDLEKAFEGHVKTLVKGLVLPASGSPERQQWEQFLWQAFPEEAPPSYTDEQLTTLIIRWIMRFVHYFLGMWWLLLLQARQFHFKNYYHPFVCDFVNLIYNPLEGISSLMKRETQLKDSGFSFEQYYQPTSVVLKLPPQYPTLLDCYPREIVDFTPDGAYSPYNWELFFHVPLFIANLLSQNQRFEEARDWYHYIFNPLGVESAIPGGSPMSKYWITKPFYETTDPQYVQQRIDNILRMLAGDTSLPGYSVDAKDELEKQVLDWRRHPFEPHRIANYRTVAYQKNVVMKYLDNLIAWGDYLFRQDSMESINEATQLYILAAEILGRRPKNIPPQALPPVETFNELENKQFDKFSNALVQVENLIPVLSGSQSMGANVAPLPMLYFCIPQNDKMLSYWDTVADRLYKIRNCMNIEGVVRQLALFEPPIDPGALVKAVAAGIDISSALADLNAPLPLYRFNVLLQKANEVCNDVKALGSALLSVLEKKDAEALSILRQGQEIHLLEAIKDVRQKQLDEAKDNLESIKRSKELAQIKKNYYESREFMSTAEGAAAILSGLSIISHTAGTVADVLAGAMFLIPDFHIGGSGFGGSPHFTAKTGGTSAGKASERGANGLYNVATILDKSAGMVATVASYDRRQEEWDFQAQLATQEIKQLDMQIAAAELRVSIAQKEFDNHVTQIENAKAVDEFMHSKYTNQDLYQWEVAQISGIYFQSYRLAYDLAKRAERCFRFELGLQDSSYINFGYWDSLKKGLLSGEKLQYDLRRLETAYIERNRREYELTKHVSLLLLDPLALVKLRETGRCFFHLPEEIFDLDHPGHYFRRIKSVSLTLPCVTGPYTTVSCTLRLLKNSIRINTANGDNRYARNTDDEGLPADDNRFVENNIPVKAIAASSGQNDSGVYELNFRDERYLPFEGAGVISGWTLELFSDLPSNNPDPDHPDFGRPLRQFDYETISDVVLHIKYTAREDAGPFKNGAIKHLWDYFKQPGSTSSLRMFNLRQEFPSEWYRFLNPINPANGNVFELEMAPGFFPIRDKNKILKINTIWLLARCTDQGMYNVVLTPPLPVPPPSGANIMSLSRLNQYGGLHFAVKGSDTALEIDMDPTVPPIKWKLKMARPGGGNLQEDPVKKIMEVEDIFLIVGYAWYSVV